MKKIIAALLTAVMLIAFFTGCGDSSKPAPLTENSPEVPAEKLTLTIGGPWVECAALEAVSAAFTAKYPNCTVVYEYMQNYTETLPKRLAASSDKLDMMLVNNIKAGSELLPFALELSAAGDKLDLSNTFESLVDNYRLQTDDPSQKGKLYSVPLGAEVRGMFVNVTLLKSLGLSVPSNLTELLDACKTLSDAGYVPLQGNPGSFGTDFLYPYVCNQVANAGDYNAVYQKVNSRADGAGEVFREPMELLYSIVENDYYKYKYVETELKLFTDASDEGYAKSFLNIVDDGSGNFVKKDDVGQVAFMPFTQSLSGTLDKTKDNYHSTIEYRFILSPVGANGGYAYLSPSRAIAVNSAGDNIDWTLKYLSFLFEEENNKVLCTGLGYIPNTKNAFELITENFAIPSSNISHLGQVTFDYDFYNTVKDTLIEISKANNPKYMQADAAGNTVMYPFDYYMENFEQRFVEQR